MASSNTGVFIGRSETLVGIEVASAGLHTAAYAIRLTSDISTNLFTPVVVSNLKILKDYTLNEDMTPDTQITVRYDPTLGQEGDDIIITLILRERI